MTIMNRFKKHSSPTRLLTRRNTFQDRTGGTNWSRNTDGLYFNKK